jgi:hypothetical protein
VEILPWRGHPSGLRGAHRLRLTLAFVAAFLVVVAPARAGTLDQEQLDGSGTLPRVARSLWLSQTFTAGLTGELDEVQLYLHRGGDGVPGPLTVEIRTVSGGVPSGGPTLATETVPEASVPTSLAFVSVPLSPAVAVTQGTQYAIVAHADSAVGFNFYEWGGTGGNTDPYPGGTVVRSGDAGAGWGGGVCGAPPYCDMAFKTFVIEDSTPPDAPQITDTDPDSPANDNNPEVKGSAEGGSTVRLYETSDCSGTPEATGSAADFASPGLTASVADDSSTDFRATATDAAGNASPCSDPFAYTEDSTSPAAPQITDTDPDPPANDNNPELKGSAEAGSTVKLYTSSDCTGSPAAQGTASAFASPGLAVLVDNNSSTIFKATATDAAGNASPCSSGLTYVEDSTPPETMIDSGPSGTTNDPTPTFTFHSSEGGSSFQCKLHAGAYAACSSPKTTAHLADGSPTFSVRANDPAGNLDPTPASRTFTVRTAAVHVSGSTLVVTAAAGAEDNFAITRPSPSVLRVTDLPGGAYAGSGVHTGAGCTRSGDYTANCSASGITLIKVTSGDQTDKVTNSTAVKSSLNGGAANDVLTGGSANDTLAGSTGADVFRGMNGNDQLFARDLTSDTTINCDGGTTPGTADKADLDLLPKDPNSRVVGCETKTRH